MKGEIIIFWKEKNKKSIYSFTEKNKFIKVREALEVFSNPAISNFPIYATDVNGNEFEILQIRFNKDCNGIELYVTNQKDKIKYHIVTE